MTNLPLRWLIQLLVTRILVASAQPSCTVLPFITAVTSTIPQPGDQVLLYCNYTGAQGVSWTKGTMIISPTLSSNPCSCVSSAIDNSNSSLAINVTYGDDYDSYTCSVQVDFGTSCIASIVVQRPIPPVLTAVGSSSQTASQGSAVTFSVSLTTPGLPLASVVWTKNGVPLYNTTNMVVTSTMLQLSNIQPGDRGQYVATATNKVNSSSAPFNLSVNYLVIDPIQVSGSSMVQLTCTAHGYPAISSITWSSPGIVIPQPTSMQSSMDDSYTYTSSSVLMVPSNCQQLYMCAVSNSFYAKTAQAPACIPSLTLIPVGGDGVFIRWNMVPGTSSYSINGTTVPCQTSLCNTTIGALVAGMTYTFVLSYGGQSVSSSITVGSGLNPITINKVSQFGASQFGMVSWSAVTGASGYLVYINKDTPLAYIVNVTTGTFTNITSICTMANITVQVQAYTLSAFSKLSPPATLLTSCAPVVKPVGQTSIYVEWTTSSDISSYSIVYQITSSSSPAMTAGPISCSGRCNYTLTGLTPEAVYTVTVVGVGGQQPVTSALQASVGSGLSAVTGVMVTSTMGYANLWWNEVPNANGYLVYVNQTITATSSITNVTTGVMVTIPISCGQPYTFGVQAYNDVGYSDVSPLVQLNSCSASSSSITQGLIIGVVVVAIFVLVSSVFCGLGVWYACKSANKNQDEVRSVSSIEGVPTTVIQETDFSRDDGPTTPTPAPSCNYLRSHKITWEHHTNTLRDLDRGGISV